MIRKRKHSHAFESSAKFTQDDFIRSRKESTEVESSSSEENFIATQEVTKRAKLSETTLSQGSNALTESDTVLQDILDAMTRIEDKVNRTPLIHSEYFDAHLKLENLQKTGAYKVRGALNTLTLAVANGDSRPVIAASAGNHGRGVAFAARELGLKATIVVPTIAPQVKVDGCLDLGAEVIRFGASFDEACTYAQELTKEKGWNFIHPFENPNIIAGQGTVGIELWEQSGKSFPDVVVVPIGGGGLISGLGLYLKTKGVRIVGAQVENVDNMSRAIEGKEKLTELPATICDGVRVLIPGVRTQRIATQVVDELVRVTEQEVRQAVAELAVHAKVVVEGAGAVAVAGLKKVKGLNKIAIVTGGNVDCTVLAEILTEKH